MSPQARTGLIAVVLVGGFIVVAGGVFAAVVVLPKVRSGDARAQGVADRPGAGTANPAAGVGLPGPKPRADKEGETWNLKELREYLASCGVRFEVQDSGTTAGIQYVAWSERPGMCRISMYPTGRAAHDALVSGADFVWGRFLFSVESRLRPPIRTALGI